MLHIEATILLTAKTLLKHSKSEIRKHIQQDGHNDIDDKTEVWDSKENLKQH